jgi:hypothetical protein
VALEKFDATQICTWAPPLPRRAFPIQAAGVTSDSVGVSLGGATVNGVQYGYFLLNTSQWAVSPNLNLPPVNVGERFQLCTAVSGRSFLPMPGFEGGEALPPSLVADAGAGGTTYAPDLFNVSMMFPTAYSVKDPTLCSVVSTRQEGANSWYVYYSPYNPSITVSPGSDGLVTVPELSSPKWLGQIGHVSGVDYSYSIPGGPDQLTCVLQTEPDYRTDAINPGRIVTAHRGGSCIWEGVLTEPVPATTTGWTLTANGCGTYGTNFGAWWQLDYPDSWSVDGPIDLAIGRGLRWANPGQYSAGGSAYLGPVQNPGSLTMTDFMNLLCTGGALSWQLVQPPSASSFPPGPWVLNLFPLPTDSTGNPIASQPSDVLASELFTFDRWARSDLSATSSRRPPDLYIVNTNPIGRTIAADINTVIVYYQVTADTTATSTATATAATYGTTFADIPGSVSRHGRLEYFLDVSSAGVMTQPQAAQIAQNVLSKYIRANFSGSFSVQPGQMLNIGGYPVDLGCNWGGYMASLQVENFAAGGEVGFGPITFQIGEYEFNDDTQTATVTPYQNARTDLASVVAQLYPGKFSLGLILTRVKAWPSSRSWGRGRSRRPGATRGRPRQRGRRRRPGASALHRSRACRRGRLRLSPWFLRVSGRGLCSPGISRARRCTPRRSWRGRCCRDWRSSSPR